MQVIRLKRLKERLCAVLGSWSGSVTAGGDSDEQGASSAGNGREESKLILPITGIVFRLSANPKKESCGDDGGLMLLEPGNTVPSLGDGESFGSSAAPEFLGLLTSFRLSERFVAKIWPTIPQYATSACSNCAEVWRKAVLIP